MIFVILAMSAASGRRIAEVLNEKSSLLSPEHPVYEVKDGSIDFELVDFFYQQGSGEGTFSNISLHIASGETVGIIGGLDVRRYDMEALRNQVAVVLQKNVLFSGTILDNLRWGKEDATEEECMEAAKLAIARAAVADPPVLILDEATSSIDTETVWGQAHVEAERTGSSTDQWIAWVKECCQ